MFEGYDTILTVEDVANILMTGKHAVYSIIKSGKLKAFRIGKIFKIPKHELINYIKNESLLEIRR